MPHVGPVLTWGLYPGQYIGRSTRIVSHILNLLDAI